MAGTSRVEKNVRGDGAIELSFRSRRTSPTLKGLAFLLLMAVMLLPASCAASYYLGSRADGQWQQTTFVLYAVLLLLMWFVVNPKSRITVAPSEGFRTRGLSLKFADVSKLGTECAESENEKKFYVVAVAKHGKLKITDYVTRDVAKELVEEILSARKASA